MKITISHVEIAFRDKLMHDNTFRITGPSWGEPTGDQYRLLSK